MFKPNPALQLSFILIVMVASIYYLPGASAAQKWDEIKVERGCVVDEHLSALRRAPDLKAPIIQRLRLGRIVYVLNRREHSDGAIFYRVAVTRRTRGWIEARAVALLSRNSDAERIMRLADLAEDQDRIALYRILINMFPRSPQRPAAMLALGKEAEAAAERINALARRRLGESKIMPDVPKRNYFLNDVSLDRYNRLGVTFDFDEAAQRYVYDGAAYRALLRQYPKSEHVSEARERLQQIELKLATGARRQLN